MAALTTSGTTTFTLSVDDIIDQAMIPLGGEHVSAVEAINARRVLNLFLIELSNKNIPISKISTVAMNTVVGQATYALDPSILDVLNVTMSMSPTSVQPQTDIKINSMGLKQYQEIPNKTQSNRPNTYVMNRLDNNCTITHWPVSDQIYASTMLCEVKIQDVTAAYQTIDLPTRYLPLLVAGLTYKLSYTRPQACAADPQLRPSLLQEYKEIYTDTVEEDRERTDFIVKPGGISGR